MNRAASELGKLSAGKPKNYSAAELKRRTAQILKAADAARKRKKRRQQNAELKRGGPPPLPPASGSAAAIPQKPNKTGRK